MIGTCVRDAILLVLVTVAVSAQQGSTQERLTALEAAVATLQTGNTALEADVATLQTANTALDSDVATLQADLAAADAAIAGLLANQTRAVGFALSSPKPATDINSRMNFSIITTNENNAWNATSAQFTCTVPGVYYFHASLAKKYGYNGIAQCRIRKNGAALVSAYMHSGTQYKQGQYNFASGVYAKLVVHDNVTLDDCLTPIANMAHGFSAFSGFLITPTN